MPWSTGIFREEVVSTETVVRIQEALTAGLVDLEILRAQ